MAKKYVQERWQNLPYQDVLELSLSELDLSVEGAWFTPEVRDFKRQLRRRGLSAEIELYFSSDWHVREGLTAIGIPFYLADARLIYLAKKLNKEIEGHTRRSFKKLLFHEVGHAVEHAYGLSNKAWRKKAFGSSSSPYPKKYAYSPYTKKYVKNLPKGYAQSHPDEDFAETFAVWLMDKNWKSKYKKWPALKKLEVLENELYPLRAKKPIKKSIRPNQDWSKSSMTLRQALDKIENKNQPPRQYLNPQVIQQIGQLTKQPNYLVERVLSCQPDLGNILTSGQSPRNIQIYAHLTQRLFQQKRHYITM